MTDDLLTALALCLWALPLTWLALQAVRMLRKRRAFRANRAAIDAARRQAATCESDLRLLEMMNEGDE